jgi:hypothetical protein
MGLSITVGILESVGDDAEGVEHFQAELAGLSQALAAAGVVWTEPAGPPPATVDNGFPYSFLHYLRRVYALVDVGEPVTPTGGEAGLAQTESTVDSVMHMFSSHLLCHSDAAGYYVPVDFDQPLFLDDAIEGGGMVGSSQALLREVVRCAAPLGIELSPAGELSTSEAQRLEMADGSDPYQREYVVWLALYEAARASVASGHAIVFG